MPTAILGFYTAAGFVIAADGLSVDDHGKAIRNNQKLFYVNDPSRKLAYGLTGAAVRINDPTDSFVALDLTKESQKIADALADNTTVDLLTYVKKFGFRLHKKINDAKNCGRISGYPPTFDPNQSDRCLIIQALFWGYYRGAPAYADFKITHRNQSLDPLDCSSPRLTIGYQLSGSPIFKLLFRESPDQRLTAFWIPAMKKLDTTNLEQGEGLSVIEARDVAINYIRACESDAGREIDPIYASKIGGDIHIASITSENGAQWMEGYKPQMVK